MRCWGEGSSLSLRETLMEYASRRHASSILICAVDATYDWSEIVQWSFAESAYKAQYVIFLWTTSILDSA